MLDKVIVFGMGGWLDLTQQGLSPCKKYRASWRSQVASFYKWGGGEKGMDSRLCRNDI